MRRSLLFTFILLIPLLGFGEKPIGRFLQDTLRLGQPIQYALSYRHPAQHDLFFPNETFDFHPFRLVKRDVFNTKTNKMGSLDSVVYTLISLDVAPIQYLQLPLFMRDQDRDCTALWPQRDSIILQQLLPQAKPLGIPFQKELKNVRLTFGFNYPALFRGLGILTLVLLVVVGIFGHQIRSFYHLFLFSRRHKDFVAHFRRLAKNHEDSQQVSKVLIIWKNHLQWLMKTPVSTFTTREIYQILPNDRLLDALSELDSTIYGGNKSNQLPFALTILLTAAQEIYQEKYISYQHKLRNKR